MFSPNHILPHLLSVPSPPSALHTSPRQRDKDYPHKDEAKVRDWIKALTGESLEAGDEFWKAVQDGSKLCKVLNKLHPGLIPEKFEKPAIGNFKQVLRPDHVTLFQIM